jgi:2-aminobenzoate-CoA ligase
MHPSAHIDSFARDNLPAESAWPVFHFDLPELDYPPTLNTTEALVDRQVAAGNGGRTAIIGAEERWTYADLQSLINRIANVLTEDGGIRPGNRVLLRFPNSPLFAACYLAVLKCGAVAVPTMPLLRKAELSVIVDKAKIDYAICDSRLLDETDSFTFDRRYSSDDISRLAADAGGEFDAVATASDDVALIAFTSGTTGKPKGCMHFHRDILAMCDTFSRNVLKPRADDVFIGSPPLAFTFGLGGLLTFPLHAGAATILLEAAPPPVLADSIAKLGATICFTAPTAYKVLLSDEHVDKLSGLRVAVSAGEHLPKPVYEEWRTKTGVTMIDGIGATEIIHIFLSMTGENDRPGSTGVPVPGYEVRVVDENLDDKPDDEAGLLAVRGPTGCKYLDDPRQADYVRGGWNLTGDVFRRDADGYFWYVARGDDMIISSGYNISGPEVEEALLAHPAVAECAVVGWPDPERGHVPKAFVVLSDSGAGTPELTRELQEFVKSAIAPYKYPRAVEYIAALPKTQTGKIKRFALRQQAENP